MGSPVYLTGYRFPADGSAWPTTRLRPGAAGWTALTLACIAIPNTHLLGPVTPDPFSVYHATADWLARNTRGNEQVLDLTDWSLYFSERPGYHFANVYEAPADPNTRWIVVRKPHLVGRWYYSQVLRELDRRPRAGRLGSASGDSKSGANPHLRPPGTGASRMHFIRPGRPPQDRGKPGCVAASRRSPGVVPSDRHGVQSRSLTLSGRHRADPSLRT